MIVLAWERPLAGGATRYCAVVSRDAHSSRTACRGSWPSDTTVVGWCTETLLRNWPRDACGGCISVLDAVDAEAANVPRLVEQSPFQRQQLAWLNRIDASSVAYVDVVMQSAMRGSIAKLEQLRQSLPADFGLPKSLFDAAPPDMSTASLTLDVAEPYVGLPKLPRFASPTVDVEVTAHITVPDEVITGIRDGQQRLNSWAAELVQLSRTDGVTMDEVIALRDSYFSPLNAAGLPAAVVDPRPLKAALVDADRASANVATIAAAHDELAGCDCGSCAADVYGDGGVA